MNRLPELALVAGLVSWYIYHRRSRAKALWGDAPYVPGPPRTSFFAGNLYDIASTLNGQALIDYTRAFGGVVRLYGTPVSTTDTLMVSDPAAMARILQASNKAWDQPPGQRTLSIGVFGLSLASVGEEGHTRQRRGLQPAFNPTPVKALMPEIDEVAQRCVQVIDRDIGPDGKAIEMDAMGTFKRWAIDSFATALFSTPLSTLEDPSHPLVHAFTNLLEDAFAPPNAFGFFVQTLVLEKLPHSVLEWLSKRDPSKVAAIGETISNAASFQTMVDHSIAERDEDSLRDDSLGQLLKKIASPDSKYSMSADELFGNVRLLLFAGHDTSATTMANICRLMAENPAWQARLSEELRAHAASSGSDLTASDLDALPCLNATIQESLRLLPIVAGIAREALTNDVLPLSTPIKTNDGRTINSLTVGKGQHVLLNLIAFNRDPNIWGPDADEFNPARWLEESSMAVPYVKSPGIYKGSMSFGAGVRACLGFRFALLELQVMVYQFFRHFKVKPVEGVEIFTVNRAVSLPRVKGRFKTGGELPVLVERV
ncbi:cytochrome P450 [Exidia glandulosa HHB12029]|uniref:Cytochrome P450 n=1 Tax=Exidia glandulosa HHB12029 TaxID=1314781 RepID=A0A165NNU9_EXIGL|nr:cytochrome P450 [Exidia glandulosa HHB12029]